MTPAGAEGPADVVVTTANGPSAPTQTFSLRSAGRAGPDLRPDAGNDGDGDGAAGRLGAAVRLQPGRPDRRRARSATTTAAPTPRSASTLTHPRGLYTRYLAEGATGSFFDTRVVRRQPRRDAGPRAVPLPDRDRRRDPRQFLVVPATSRRTIDLRACSRGWRSANISTVVESDVQVVVDRTMRWDQVSRFGAHAESSSPAPSLTWYLAEGATHGAFDLFYLIQNPSQTQTAQVQHPLPAARGRRRSSRTSTSCRIPARPSTSTSSPGWRPPTSRR